MIDLAALTPQDFEPLVGKGFVVRGDEGALVLTLDNIKLLSEATIRDSHIEIDGKVLPPRRAFSLVLEGPREPLLDGCMHEVEIPGLGQAALFVSPFRQDQTCALYEINFS
ncbi:DUF6916 family protein [Tropicibacter oceani]|uniref:DUF6916 domain-containing protein n=1 Tax=Tropicibacter oceani TaxID=3058420 RepID=A0ABY8QEC2_9RHOB|nr:hypothetical protein [Tropicibacter oceani]WGW02977.1 hypothetical protein QF118_13680 [Tropicibacter oceani]